MENELTAALVQEAVALEQSDRNQEAISSYLKAIQVMTDLLCSNRQLTNREKLEIQYNIDNCIARSRFLLGVSSITDHHDLSSENCEPYENVSPGFPDVKSAEFPNKSQASSHVKTNVAKIDDTNIKEQLLASVFIECPNIELDSIIGLEYAKQPIREAVLVPIMFPDTIQAKNAWKGILLFGVTNFFKS